MKRYDTPIMNQVGKEHEAIFISDWLSLGASFLPIGTHKLLNWGGKNIYTKTYLFFLSLSIL